MSEPRGHPTHPGGHRRARLVWQGVAKAAAQRWPPGPGVEARLRLPPSERGLVPRKELVARLLEAGDPRVVLLTAGAGFGKTSLLTQWAERDHRPFAWVSLDDTDDEPAALVADVLQALEAIDPCGEDEPLPPHPAAAHGRGTLARPWLPVAARTRPFVLVLDDVHVLQQPRCLALLPALVDNLPPGSQLAVAGRREPALPLARWTLRGDLLRLGPEELAMSRAEARLLIGDDPRLSRGAVDALHRKTGGWPAGLRMAGIGLREQRAAGRTVTPFGGHERLVADYLRDEVLGPLGPDVTRFLTATSMLDRLSGPLCDAVLERTGSAPVLRDLERSCLFVRPAYGDRGWYRCHPLLGEMLLADLRLQGEQAVVDGHRRASAWYEASGDPAAAIRHARAAGDARRAGDLLWAGLRESVSRGELRTPAGWLAAFGDGEIAAQPTLALAAAWCCLDAGDAASARRWAAIAEGGSYDGTLRGGPASPGAAAAILRALFAAEGVARMAEDATLGRAGEPAASAWTAVCHLLEGVARRLRGDAEGARASLTEAEQVAISASAPAPLVRSLAQLAVLAAEAGDWRRAAGLVARARAASERVALRDVAGGIELHAVSALVLAQVGRPADAARDARRCVRLLGSRTFVPPWLAVDARVLLARASLLVGDAAASRLLLREGRRLLARTPDGGELGGRLDETWRRVEAYPLAGIVAPAPLSRAELRVLRLMPTHLSYRQIGERLHVSQCTVKSQALSAYRKLEVSSRSQAVERATVLGLVPANDAPCLAPGLR
jgi:LuxR family transcriptional regulator, maltose regulon positive regulatory protein